MQNFIFVTLLLFAMMNTHAINNNKQKALSAVEHFFSIKNQKVVLEGRYLETDPDYGRTCKIYVDFSQIGNEYLTVAGEYTPLGNIGDGIYFNEDDATFTQVEFKTDFLSLEQQFSDSFSTGMKTKVVLSKVNNTLKFSISKQTSFLLFPQTVEKNCIVENYQKIPEP
jgi:hypothetical protein